jgi:hypothetical protein
MATKKNVKLSVGRGEKLSVSKGASSLSSRNMAWNSPVCKDGFWICIKCKEEKELSMFYKKRNTKNGYTNVCKTCESVRTKEKDKRRSNESVLFFIKRLLSGRMSGMNSNSRKANWGINLNAEIIYEIYLKQNGLCAITKEKMTNIAGKGKVTTNISIDRIDSNKKYEIENIQLVCYIVNIMKNNFTIEELISWSDKICKNAKKDS